MTTTTGTAMSTEPTAPAAVEPVSPALLRLMQLVSPALPVGAYAYSHALEWAVSDGWVKDESGVERWIGGLLHNVWSRVDVPVLMRLVDALQAGDTDAVRRWVDFLNASRESAELQAEDRGMGQALARLLTDLGVAEATPWATDATCVMPLPWAMAAIHWRITPLTSAAGLLWTYVEHQVSAAVKLVPLGQTAGQRLLGSLGEQIPAAVARGMAVPDHDIGAAAPGLAIASALHETQYSRLFRS